MGEVQWKRKVKTKQVYLTEAYLCSPLLRPGGSGCSARNVPPLDNPHTAPRPGRAEQGCCSRLKTLAPT